MRYLRYLAIVVGALVTMVSAGLLYIIVPAVMSGTEVDPVEARDSVGWQVLFAVVLAIAPVVGGVVAGLIARTTRDRRWVIGAGGGAGFGAAAVVFLIGVLANASEEGQQIAGAADVLPLVIWTLAGALGGALVWALARRDIRQPDY